MPPSFPFYHSSLQQTITTMASHHVPLNVVGYTTTPPKHSTFLITVTVLAVTVTVTVFLALYFLLRHLHCSCLRSVSPSSAVTAATFSSSPRISPVISTNTTYSAVDSLPLFTFSSITRRSSGGSGGDCAVCLSKFEQCDLLRLLPLCCHAFHAECIDTWLRSNHTCPLCRSTVFASESDVMKILWSPAIDAGAGNSFRLEIGNISDREGGGETRRASMTSSRSYSLGSFEYLVDEEAEITLSDAHRRNVSGEKDDVAAAESTAVSEPSPAGDLASGRSWLKDYVDQLSASISTMSFRSSGRFFTGSSRRSDDVVFAGGDYEVGLETNRLGEEISEMFRWLSGV